MKNQHLLEEIHSAKNHKASTRNVYRVACEKYCKFNEMLLEDLLQEAENEEKNKIDWKYRKLKQKLINFRSYLIEYYPQKTVETYFNTIIEIYNYYEITIGKLPKVDKRSYNKTPPITFKDLPDKEIIREALKISTPLMSALILFMSSSGCARTETLNLTIQDYIDSVQEYVKTNNLTEIIDTLNNTDDVIPTFNILRVKTNKYYTTYCSPEAVHSINSYLLSRTDPLKPEAPLFKIHPMYVMQKFKELNNELGLGKIGKYNRFRSHMLRKFHASSLYNDGMSIDKVNDLQGKSKTLTDQSYFMVNPDDLKYEYIEHLPCLLMGKDVEKVSVKSPEYHRLEQENKKYKDNLSSLWDELNNLKSRQEAWEELKKRGSENNEM